MNKKEFIKSLESKLEILEEAELKDIINEYKDTIDEKVKHGKTEKEAVADFGSIDELAKEILKAYKINPKYGDKKDPVKDVVDDCETLIKKGANKMASWSKDFVEDFKNSNNTLSIELIFEILIKAIILLVLFALLRLPFGFIGFLGESILDVAFYPLDIVLVFVWKALVWVLYFVCCVLISLAMFKQYFYSIKKEEKISSKKVDKKTEEREELKKKIVEEEIYKEVRETKRESNFISSFGHVVFSIVKFFVILCCLLPLWCINFGIYTVIVLSVYYLFIGINTLGVFLLSVGLGVLFTYSARIIYNLVFQPKKVYFFPFVISLIFMVIGGLFTIDAISRLDYYDTMPETDLIRKSDEFEYNVTDRTYVRLWDGKKSEVIDNGMEDGKIILEVTYFEKISDIHIQQYLVEENYNGKLINVMRIDCSSSIIRNSSRWDVYHLVIDNLKKNKIYDYRKLFDLEIKIIGNEKTLDLIK